MKVFKPVICQTQNCSQRVLIVQTLIRGEIIWLVDLGCDLIRQYSFTYSDYFDRNLNPGEHHLRNSQPRPVYRVGGIKVHHQPQFHNHLYQHHHYLYLCKVRSGCGPRHMAFHPSRPFAYILCEQLPLVLVYRWGPLLGIIVLKCQSA